MKKEVTITLGQEEISNLMIIVEDKDKEEALKFCKNLKEKITKTKSSFRSVYHSGDHIGPAKLK